MRERPKTAVDADKLKMDRWVLLLPVGLIIRGALLITCSSGDVKKSETAVNAEVSSDSHALPWSAQTQRKPKATEPVAPDLDGGVTVHTDNNAGYWVKDGKVYITNGIPLNWSTSAGHSPEKISQPLIEETVSEHYGE